MSAPGPPAVSRREAEILAAIGAHLTNAEIADRLFISIRTVETHVSSLLRKYGVTDRRALARVAEHRPAEPRPAEQPRVAGLPVPRTSFVGRAHEHDTVLAAVGTPGLVTLLGPGGVGKTRLAAVVAHAAGPSFPGGGAFVDLVPVRDGFVAQAVAALLRVTEAPQLPLVDAIVARLRHARTLLVLDNCEHLVEAAEFAERLLAAGADTTILATSRERLGIPGERTIPIGPLPLVSDAEQLFRDRARAADPEFDAAPAAVAEICARLDGMPLAIELAAARSASLGVPGLLSTLHDSLRLLAGSRAPDERHRSLRAVLDWSHRLLDGEERALLRRLAVFAGRFDLDAAAAVTGLGGRGEVADVLGHLVDKSLVRYEREASRWRLLETTRAYAADQLTAAGELADARQRHLMWAAASAGELERRLGGAWTDDFDAVADDLRAALSSAPSGRGEVPHRLARSLARLTYARRFLQESLAHYRCAADLAPTDVEAATDLRAAAGAVWATGHAGQAYELLLASAQRARAGGDRTACAIALAQAAVTAARFPGGFPAPIPRERIQQLIDDAAGVGNPHRPAVAAHLSAARMWLAGLADTAAANTALAAARATGDPILISGALDAVGAQAVQAGRLRQAHRIAEDRLDLLSTMDSRDPHRAAEILDTFQFGWLAAFAAGDLPATLRVAELIRRDHLLGVHPYRATSRLVPVLVMLGRFAEAIEHAQHMWDGWQRAGSPAAAWMSPGVGSVALAHGLLGDDAGFVLWRARARQAAGDRNPKLARYHASFAAFVDARVAVHRGHLADADVLVERAFAEFPEGWHRGYARAAGAELAIVAGLPDAAERLAEAIPAAEENDWAAACLARTAGRLHRDTAALTDSVARWERIGARFERACTLLLLPDRAAEGGAELAALGGLSPGVV